MELFISPDLEVIVQTHKIINKNIVKTAYTLKSCVAIKKGIEGTGNIMPDYVRVF